MYIYPAGAGCSGVPRRVEPGDEDVFSSGQSVDETEESSQGGLSQYFSDNNDVVTTNLKVETETTLVSRYAILSVFRHFYL